MGPKPFFPGLRRLVHYRGMAASRIALIAATLVLLALSAVAALYYAPPHHRVSAEAFLAFYCAGQAVDQHKDPYLLEPLRSCEHANGADFAVPAQYVEPAPLPGYSLALFVVLGRLPYTTAWIVWCVVLIVSLAVAAVACARVTKIPIAVAFAGFAVIGGFVNMFYAENVPVVLAALTLTAAFVKMERFFAAAICASITLIEPHVGLAVCMATFFFVPKTRLPLLSCGLALAALSAAVLSPAENAEYLLRTLALQARAEIPALDQYSLTWLLHVAGVSDRAALFAGSASYVLMLVAGILVGGRLAKKLGSPELLVFTPAAFVLIGGAYIHDVQMVLAVPLGFALAKAFRYPLLAWGCVILLSIPSAIWWGSLRVPIFTLVAVFALAVYAFANARLRYALPAAIGVAAGAAAFIAVGRHLPATFTSPPFVGTEFSPNANASSNWGDFIRHYSPPAGAPPRYIFAKLQTWFGLLGLAGLSIAGVLPGRVRKAAVKPAQQAPATECSALERLPWLDAVKGIALLWIFLNHIVERIFGGEYIANPGPRWPALSIRLAQLAPTHQRNFLLDALVTVVRDVGWLGDAGVGVFLILSGLGLAYGLRGSQGLTSVFSFYQRRFVRILPTWWGAHILFVGTFLVTGFGLDPFNIRTVLSFLGIRFLPQTFYYFSPAWWYVGLLLQLYLIFPLVYRITVRRGAATMLLVTCAAGFVSRAIGLYAFGSYVDEWQRGAIFLTRLPEFAFGIALAWWLIDSRTRTDALLRSWAAAPIFLCGCALALTSWGMIFAPFVLSVSSSAICYNIACFLAARAPRIENGLALAGRHSYAAYLVHQPLVGLTFPAAPASLLRLFSGTALFSTLVFGLTAVLERGTDAVERLWKRLASRAPAVAAVSAVGFYALLLLGDAAVATYWPQEVGGWGERASLALSKQFGWALVPSATTRLRWETYDYVVTSNTLGFPGPEFTVAKPPNTLRVLTVGDAFTSAEGVNTDRSWPRVAQSLLSRRLHRSVQVLNFAVTGYGPNQYDAVVRAFSRRYHVDVVLVGMFVNDYGDVITSNRDFVHSIGFDRRAVGSLRRHLELFQLRRFLALKLSQRIADVFGKPNSEGYALGNFAFFERTPARPFWTEGARVTRARLKDIAETARSSGAEFSIVLFPAAIQVCRRDQLAYYPRALDFGDRRRFDSDRPQNVTARLARSLNAPYLDLRAALGSGSRCLYQPQNMHLTVSGQRVAAEAISAWLPVR